MRNPAIPKAELPFAADPVAYNPDRFARFCDEWFDSGADTFYDPVTGSHVLFHYVDVATNIADRDSQRTLDPETSKPVIAAHLVTIPLIGKLMMGALPVTANQDGPVHRAVRDALEKGEYGLSPSARIMSERYGRLVAHEVNIQAQRIDGLDKKSIDLVTEFAQPISAGVIAATQGMPHAASRMKEMADGQTALLGQKLKGVRLFRALRSLVRLLDLNERAAEASYDQLAFQPPYDLTSQLVEQVGIDNARSAGMNLGAAGYSTTSGLIGNAARVALSDPRRLLWDALGDPSDPIRQRRALTEAERLETSLAGWKGVLNKNTTLAGGTELPKGTKVLYALAMANRDPKIFSEPHAVLLDRPEVDQEARGKFSWHVTYGRGPHNCVGRSLAQLEIMTAFAALRDLERCKGSRLELVPPANSYQYEPDSLFRTLKSLPVTWQAAT